MTTAPVGTVLESLNLSTSQPGLWEMTRSICDSAEERLNRASPKVSPKIRKAMGYIQNHLAENIQRDTLGRLIHYDSVYFSKLFKRAEGVSPTEYRKSLAEEGEGSTGRPDEI